jgi:hypothetical protein
MLYFVTAEAEIFQRLLPFKNGSQGTFSGELTEIL